MTKVCVILSENENLALKAWSVTHGYKSKADAATYMVEWWLREKGYLGDTIEEQLFNEGYENS